MFVTRLSRAANMTAASSITPASAAMDLAAARAGSNSTPIRRRRRLLPTVNSVSSITMVRSGARSANPALAIPAELGAAGQKSRDSRCERVGPRGLSASEQRRDLALAWRTVHRRFLSKLANAGSESRRYRDLGCATRSLPIAQQRRDLALYWPSVELGLMSRMGAARQGSRDGRDLRFRWRAVSIAQ